MLCPLILTTVSEELDVEELTSFTINPAKTKTFEMHFATASLKTDRWHSLN